MKRLMNRAPAPATARVLAALPFIVALFAYLLASDIRLEANPGDKLLPSMRQMGAALHRLAAEPSGRTGELVFWGDTAASLRRLLIGVGVSALLGLVVGMATGVAPYVRGALLPFVTAFSMVPPMAVLPVLFIVFGLGELSKVALIVFGVAPILMRDIHQRVEDLPKEQAVKALTLGADTWGYAVRVVLPQVLPRLLDAVRLALGTAWIFLISAEAIAAESGLGYRIFLVRRYLAMDVILPYVAWITLLAFGMDYGLRRLTAWRYPWYGGGR